MREERLSMDLELTGVYVPRGGRREPDRGGRARGPDRGDEPVWPRPVYRPGDGEGEGRDEQGRELARRVEAVLGAPLGPRGPDIAPVLRDPGLTERIVDRMAREAARQDCSAVAALEPGGLAFGTTVSVRAGLPLVVIRRSGGPTTGAETGRRRRGEDGGSLELPAGALGAGDRVLLMDDVAVDGATLSEAAHLVEETGARVTSICVVVEASGGEGRRRIDDRNMLSILTI